MKTTVAMMATLAVAYADVPAKSFHVKHVLAGYASACRGLDTVAVASTPEALTWNLRDYKTIYPRQPGSKDDSVTYCVMETNLADFPPNWRFTVDSVKASGAGKFTGGAQVHSMGTYLGLSVGYIEDRTKPISETKWLLKEGGLGSYELKNSGLTPDGKDLNGDFQVQLPRTYPNTTETLWSPCFEEDNYYDWYRTQMGYQITLYMGEEEGSKDAQGVVDDDLTVKLNLKWEKCDSTKNNITTWGKLYDNGNPNWVPL